MSQPNNPLHGVTLEQVVTRLAEHFGWASLGEQIRIHCFQSDPSVKSSLKFLRKTPWAREKVEALYLATFDGDGRVQPAPSRAPKPRAPARVQAHTKKPQEPDGKDGRTAFNPWLKS